MTLNESRIYRQQIKQYLSSDISEDAMFEMDCLMMLSPDALQACDQYVVDLTNLDFELPPPGQYMWEKSLNPEAVIPRGYTGIMREASFHEKSVVPIRVRYEAVSKRKIWILTAFLLFSAAAAAILRSKYKDATRKEIIRYK